jgi:hypothetical protein
MKNTLVLILLVLLMSSCAVSKKYTPSRKFSVEQLKEDYSIFREILEESHPSLYWYTPKDSMDLYFQHGYDKIRDSMQEYQFRNVLSYVVSKIRCGHTSVRASREAAKYSERVRSYAMPLNIKAWPDTAVVSFNLNRKDSFITRGTQIKSIENRDVNMIIDSFFSHLSSDGYNTTHKYQVISNGGTFRNMYATIFGLRAKMKVEYYDSLGNTRSALMNIYNPSADTPAVRVSPPKIPRKERKKRILASTRNIRIDTAAAIAILEINSFATNMKLRKFLRQSFREIDKMKIHNLVVDLRGNGGGNVVLSNLLTRYIAKQPFKLADSIYSIKRTSRYSRYIDNSFQTWLFHLFMTRKSKDGKNHFRYYENRYFKPRSKHHFDGDIYLLTGGNTFSAASLVAKSLKGQENVLIVGEETGGGAYGNSAWLIPDVTLPHSKLRFRLPLFRLVMDKNIPKGFGVLPDVYSLPTAEAIRKNTDFKMDKVREIISTKKEKAASPPDQSW